MSVAVVAPGNGAGAARSSILLPEATLMFNLGIVRNRNAKTAFGAAAASEPADVPADSDKALDDADLEHVAGGRSLDWFDDFQSVPYRTDVDPS